jgi:hypothetical protein
MDLTTGNDENKTVVWINWDKLDLHVYTVKPV